MVIGTAVGTRIDEEICATHGSVPESHRLVLPGLAVQCARYRGSRNSCRLPVAASSHVTVTLSGSPAGGYEFLKGCTNTAPYSCYTRTGALPFEIDVSNLRTPITVGYTTQDGTAVSGEDYQATSGQVTIQPNARAGTSSVICGGPQPGCPASLTGRRARVCCPRPALMGLGRLLWEAVSGRGPFRKLIVYGPGALSPGVLSRRCRFGMGWFV